MIIRHGAQTNGISMTFMTHENKNYIKNIYYTSTYITHVTYIQTYTYCTHTHTRYIHTNIYILYTHTHVTYIQT